MGRACSKYEEKKTHKILVSNPGVESLLRRFRLTREDNVEMNLREM
jgi:hypothetical protein